MACSKTLYEADDRLAVDTLNGSKKMNVLSIKLSNEFQDQENG